MEPQYVLREIHPGIWLAEFSDRYDLCMTFCRYQEFYESADPEIRNSKCSLLDLIEKYSRTLGDDSFTYVNDWVGFNVPGKKIKECFELHRFDHNKYDQRMEEIISQCEKHGDFYLIGSLKGDSTTNRHEVAHGIYYLNAEYRAQMDELSLALPASLRAVFHNYLKTVGYVKDVWEDEIQAYMATALPDPEDNEIWEQAFVELEAYRKPFVKLLKQHFR